MKTTTLTKTKFLPDGSVDPTQPGNAFDDILDEIHSTYSSARHEDPIEQERIKREEKIFCREFANALARNLTPQGFVRFRVVPDAEGEGYVITVTDKEGREFKASYTYDAALELEEKVTRNFSRVLVQQMTEAILIARKDYFEKGGDGLH